jgi:hypothetical protein
MMLACRNAQVARTRKNGEMGFSAKKKHFKKLLHTVFSTPLSPLSTHAHAPILHCTHAVAKKAVNGTRHSKLTHSIQQ